MTIQTPTTDIQSLVRDLQARRNAAYDARDWIAHAAYDLLIGHVLGIADMYAETAISLVLKKVA